MSLHTLPVLFFNLGGEMLYILDQRLRAQDVPQSKAQQVVQDIVNQMFDGNCIQELFRPQRVLSMKSLRIVFNRLAHASIMKLNSSAMDKLCDLMVMAVKYQLLMCRRGEDIVLVTLNHIDTIRNLVGESQLHISMLDSATKTLVDLFNRSTLSDFFLLRCTLLSVFQDTHKRVSIFLKSGSQNTDGRFHKPAGGPVPNGFEIPGALRHYDEKGNITSETTFRPPVEFKECEPPGSWALRGDRVSTLGLNMYAASKSKSTTLAPRIEKGHKKKDRVEEEEKTDGPDTERNTAIAPELTFLERLLQIPKTASSDTFKLSLFSDEESEEEEETEAAGLSSTGKSATSNPEILRLDTTKTSNAMLAKIAEDFSSATKVSMEEDDLLDLLDEAL